MSSFSFFPESMPFEHLMKSLSGLSRSNQKKKKENWTQHQSSVSALHSIFNTGCWSMFFFAADTSTQSRKEKKKKAKPTDT